MQIEVFEDAEAVARAAAAILARHCSAAVDERGAFSLAVSGGTTPWRMLRQFSEMDMAWDSVHVLQVDERIAPAGDPDRNVTHLQSYLLDHVPLPPTQVYAMPVERLDLEEAAADYVATLRDVAGEPPVLDLVHLGLGADGHTASLVPNDPVLEVSGRDVAVTDEYGGRRRMTMTYPLINRARHILWVVTGANKAEMLLRLREADPGIAAGRIRQDSAVVLADRDAAALL